MSENWDQYSENWDGNKDVIVYSEKAYKALTQIGNPKNLNILDFGCGTGRLTERLAPVAKRILALDTSEKMISVLNSKNLKNVDTLAVELSEESIKSQNLLKTKFDLIVASSVCAFLPDYENKLRLLKSLLKPKSFFIQWDWLTTDEANFGFTKESVKTSFINSGLKVYLLTEAFSMEGEEGSMKVLMGVGSNG